MQETIYPDLQSSVLCEDVRNEASGQQTLVGVVSTIVAPGLPIVFFKLCVWSRWCNGSGTFLQQTFLLNAEDEERVAVAEVHFTLRGIESHATNVNFFGGIQLPTLGTYHVEIHLENELRLRYPFVVLPAPTSS